MKILLHICCAPCSTEVIQRLRDEGHDITGYFYNPNIQPQDEYNKRLEDARRYSQRAGIELIEGEADFTLWNELTSGLEHESEGGSRCKICYEARLKSAREAALNEGCDCFTTTLSISPYKNADTLNEIGNRLAGEKSPKYLEANFKKQDGYNKSIHRSTQAGLYRQDYCGCIHSKNERELKSG
jgi:predicted adenine nucleotide alpha hydrolase (AANH) superfamily ATPase